MTWWSAPVLQRAGRDVRRGDPAERAEVLANLAAVPLPATDPLEGADGPPMRAWADIGGDR